MTLSQVTASGSTADVLALVCACPGLSRAAVATRLGGRRAYALAAVREAVDVGVVREGPTQVPIRAGGTRTTVGLFPAHDAPVPQGGPPAGDLGEPVEQLDGAGVRALRLDAGVALGVLADHLGVTRQQLHRWETGRQPLPRSRGVAAALAAAQAETLAAVIRTPGARGDVREVVREVRQAPGLTRRQLARGSHRRTQALGEALEAHLVHAAPSWRPGASRACVGLFPGPGATQVGGRVLVAALRHAREQAGWARPAMAARLGVATTTVQRWEERLVFVPVWASTLAAEAVLEAQRVRRVPARELEREVSEAVHAEPGISRAALARRLHYARQDGAVGAALLPLLEAEVLHERHAGKHGQQSGLFPGPPPPPPLTPAALRARREALGAVQAEVAAATGVTVSTYRPWEQGTRPMSLERQWALLDALGALEAAPSRRSRLRAGLLAVLAEGDATRHGLHCAAAAAGLGSRLDVDVELTALEASGDVRRARVGDGVEGHRGRVTTGRWGFTLGPSPTG